MTIESSDTAPETLNPTPFEVKYGFEPLGDDVEGRVARMEELLSVYLEPSLPPSSSSIYTERTMKSPDIGRIQDVLGKYRTKQALDAHSAAQRSLIDRESEEQLD